MEQMTDLNATFHIRMASILSLLSLVDAVFLTVTVTSILTKGPDMMLVFAFEVGSPISIYSSVITLNTAHDAALDDDCDGWEIRAPHS